MDTGPANIKIYQDYFSPSRPISKSSQDNSPSTSLTHISNSSSIGPTSHSRNQKNLRRAAFMLRMFTLRRLSWGSSTDDQEKVVLTAAELESLRTELQELEERESYLKAQLEHVDEVLRSARLSGYLNIRTRWNPLPGEPPIDDTDVDDWLPRFVVLHGSCIFFYLKSTDLSPQDSSLLSDIVEICHMPSFKKEDEEIKYCFYILTHHGLRYECSSNSKTQVDSWVSALRSVCKAESDTKVPIASSGL